MVRVWRISMPRKRKRYERARFESFRTNEELRDLIFNAHDAVSRMEITEEVCKPLYIKVKVETWKLPIFHWLRVIRARKRIMSDVMRCKPAGLIVEIIVE